MQIVEAARNLERTALFDFLKENNKMTISKCIVPFEWLCEKARECDDLADVISTNNAEDQFNDYVEEYFNGQIPSETELNDFMRFNQDIILEALGISLDDD